jgi:hypothetical protein
MRLKKEIDNTTEIKYKIEKYHNQMVYQFSFQSQRRFFFYKALIDFGANVICIREGLMPIKYFENSTYQVHAANGNILQVNFNIFYCSCLC